MRDEPDISLQRQSTAEVVADTLMGMIVTGTLAAGAPLRESTLAARLGISRNSLREGIRLLEQSRLVKYEIHRGAVVSTPTVSDLEDLYRTRLHIEVAAVREPVTPQTLAAIESSFEVLTAATRSLEVEPIVAADLALHEAFVGLLRSDRMSAFYSQIREEMVFYFTVLSHADAEYASPEEPIVARHREIVDAIRDGRREEAAEFLRMHIEKNFERLKMILELRDATA